MLQDSPDYPAVLKVLAQLLKDAQAKLRATYADAACWQVAHGGRHLSARIVKILSVLPTLKCLRLLQSDRPWKLGGWLDPSDADMMLRQLKCSPRNHEPLYTAKDYDSTGFTPIFDAIASTKAQSDHLRLELGHAPPPRNVTRMLHATGIILSLRRL
jgi:hypothetical protein